MASDSEALVGTDVETVVQTALSGMHAPLWLYEFDTCRISWANNSALTFWNADSIEDLAARNLGADMSDGVKARLSQYRDDFRADPGQLFRETWTLYPSDKPVLLECTFRWCPLPDGRPATLVEGRALHQNDPVTVRSLDALLHSQVMTALFTENGQVLYANRALREAMGRKPRVFGEGFTDPDARARFYTGLATNGNYRETIQLQTVRRIGWYDVQAVRCRDAATGKQAFQISATNVTAMREAEEELRAARDRALSADRAKSEFVASMSHEMRTPMNGVLGIIELLSRSDLNDAQAHQVGILRDCSKALMHLIEDVLDLSSIELGSLRLKPGHIEIRTLARSVVEGLRQPAEEKGLKLLLEIAPDVPDDARGDGARLAQLIRNLIGNAIKYTQTGWVVLGLSAKTPSRLRVEVTDSGPGIPAADRDIVFEKFTQLATTGSRGGCGLGLSICREIVDMFGGTIGVDEAKGGGATFWFELPDLLEIETRPAEDFGLVS